MFQISVARIRDESQKPVAQCREAKGYVMGNDSKNVTGFFAFGSE
jgi:hypothetical protein